MCSVSLGLMAAGTLISGYSAYDQGQAAKAQSRYNSRVAENNAQSARNEGNARENQKRMETAKLQGEQEAAFGAANVQLDSGSAANILSDTERYGEIDALNIRNNVDTQYQNYLNDSTNTLLQGDNAASAGALSGFGSLLSGGSQVASKWYPKR